MEHSFKPSALCVNRPVAGALPLALHGVTNVDAVGEISQSEPVVEKLGRTRRRASK